MGILFGPIPSRRLGRSLGINNIPAKVCSYSCVYCQVGLTTTLSVEQREFYSPNLIYADVRKRLEELKADNEAVDYLSFVPDGEPTLDINLADTIYMLKNFGIKIAVFTNSSLIWKKEVQEALNLADYVSVKIDSIDEATWKKINHPSHKLDLNKILDGILEFKKNYSGKLVTETMLISGINDNDDDLIKTSHYIVKVEPDIAYLTVPTRPTPIKNIRAPKPEKSISIFKIFKSIYPKTELLNVYEGNEFSITDEIEEGLVSIMAVHPMRKDAVENYLLRSKSDWSVIDKLIETEKIIEIEYDGNIFYKNN
ncbi:MAG TPA: radical SAM protein [Ignavibacteriaceae bacterium]|nr:MAG: molybdenum cofactor biosynthesis protein A [Ignavibacteria bacterium ADurb.Bin266]HQF41728.1 radical SAM protein [Ignavibacteriaceae bacterium]HQI40967.1 radical SAM protein [Ignavibacteriaceae bacterium]